MELLEEKSRAGDGRAVILKSPTRNGTFWALIQMRDMYVPVGQIHKKIKGSRSSKITRSAQCSKFFFYYVMCVIIIIVIIITCLKKLSGFPCLTIFFFFIQTHIYNKLDFFSLSPNQPTDPYPPITPKKTNLFSSFV